MKKKFLSIALAAILAVGVLAGLGGNFKAFAQSSIGQTADDYFLQTVEEFGYGREVEFDVNTTYNEKLQPNGFEYVFEADDEPSYALMIQCQDYDGNTYYDILEIFFGTSSPFAEAQGNKIYIKMFTYIDYFDGNYYDLADNIILNEEMLNEIAEQGFNYNGYANGTSITETIDFDNKYDSSFEFQYGIPSYYRSDYPGACSNIAGGIILGYYNIFYPNLIPNYTTHYYSNNKWRYYDQGAEVTGVINDLHFKMQTNVNGGTTIANFKSGLTAYVSGKGRSTAFSSVMSVFSFDYSKYKTQVDAGVPVALFLSKYNVIENDMFLKLNGDDYITTNYFTVNHTMVGSGYREVSYYRYEMVSVWSPVWYNPFRFVEEAQSVNFRNDTYLAISPAIHNAGKGYMRLNDNAVIEDAFGVKIS